MSEDDLLVFRGVWPKRSPSSLRAVICPDERYVPIRRLALAATFMLVFCAALLESMSASGEPARVRTAMVQAIRTSDPLLFEGLVQALRYAEVSNRIDGVISAVHFSLGLTVEKGDLLFELAPETYEAAVLAARANLDRARAEFRQKQLVLDQQDQLRSKGVASELRYHEAANDAAVASAEVAAAEAAVRIAQLELSRTKLSAPIGGWIGEALVALGSFVEAESERPLAKIVQLDPIRVVYDVPYERRLRALSQTDSGTVEELFNRVTVQLRLPGGDVYPQRSRPVLSAAEIDPSTGMLQVSAMFPNPDLVLLPGLPVQVMSYVEGAQQTLSSVPREAARTDQAGLHVLVVQPSGLIERRPVSVFRTHNDNLLVSGVFEGELVVSDAEVQAVPGAVVTPDLSGIQ